MRLPEKAQLEKQQLSNCADSERKIKIYGIEVHNND